MRALRLRVILAVAGVASLALVPPAVAQGYEDPPPGALTVNVGNATVTEGNSGLTMAVFAVTLSAASESQVTVNFAAPPPVQPVGDATANTDYQATSGTATIPAGATTTTIQVPVSGDTMPEPHELFYVHLSNPTGGAAIGAHHGKGTINDDDSGGGTIADTTPPNTMIHGGPRRTTRARTASFHLMSTEAYSKFQCKLDRGPWRACGERKTYRRLKKGWHTFLARAIDSAGNRDQTPAKRRWRIR
jgi:hypothetical protein